MMSSQNKRSQVSSTYFMSPLQRDILKTLLYFDIFNHPLKPEEIYQFLLSNSTNPVAIQDMCKQHPLSGVLKEEQGFYSLRTNGSSTRAARITKERRAKKLWRIARWMTTLISKMPFVRAVGISGELSKGVASEKADIDFFIITAAHRLWICRTLLILFKKIFLWNSKKYFCVNLFVTEDHLDVEIHNLYSATEVATLRPLHNLALYQRYVQANHWILNYFPNWEPTRFETPSVTKATSILQKILELPFENSWGEKLDVWLMEHWKHLWKLRYPNLDDERRDHLFRCRSFISTAYGEDFLNKVLDSYIQRLRELSID